MVEYPVGDQSNFIPDHIRFWLEVLSFLKMWYPYMAKLGLPGVVLFVINIVIHISDVLWF